MPARSNDDFPTPLLPHDQNHTSDPRLHLGQQIVQHLQLVTSPHKEFITHAPDRSREQTSRKAAKPVERK
jgi:hypothetical protein